MVNRQYGINIADRSATALAANTLSGALQEGAYDVSTTEDTYVAVIKADRAISTSTDYKIPANQIISVQVPATYKIKANKAISFFRVSE